MTPKKTIFEALFGLRKKFIGGVHKHKGGGGRFKAISTISEYKQTCDRMASLTLSSFQDSRIVTSSFQDDQGRHEVGMVENTVKTPIGDLGQGCLFEARLILVLRIHYYFKSAAPLKNVCHTKSVCLIKNSQKRSKTVKNRPFW